MAIGIKSTRMFVGLFIVFAICTLVGGYFGLFDKLLGKNWYFFPPKVLKDRYLSKGGLGPIHSGIYIHLDSDR